MSLLCCKSGCEVEPSTEDHLRDYIQNLDPALVESAAQFASTLRLVRLMIANELAMHEKDVPLDANLYSVSLEILNKEVDIGIVAR